MQNKTILNGRDKGMKEALSVLKTLSHPLRLSILCTLIEEGETLAGDIVAHEGDVASQSQVSQYLSQMKKQGLIKDRRDGHYIYYSIADRRIETLMASLHKLYCGVK